MTKKAIVGILQTDNRDMFHVKHLLISLRLLVLIIGIGPTFGAQAEVFKCVDAQGKMTFSDQPCSSNQKGGAVKVVPQAGGSNQKAAVTDRDADVTDTAEVQKRRAELLQSLTPECQNLTRRFIDLDDRVIPEYLAKCDALVRAFMKKYDAQKDSVVRLKYECDTIKSVLDERRPKFAQLDDQSKRAFSEAEQKYASLKCK